MNEGNILEAGNVMIVEDEQDFCYLLSMVLKRNNLDSQCVNSLGEARKTINELKPSVVFLDNHLPDGYGSNFIPTVKKLFPSAKIVMMTAYDGPADIDLAFNKGADYFIGKPFTSKSILTTLDLLRLDMAKKIS